MFQSSSDIVSIEAASSASVTDSPVSLGMHRSGATPAAGIRTAWVLAFVSAGFAAWTLLPAWLAGNLHPDTLESLYWGQHWLWGYHKHPPLAAWSAELVHAVFGSANWAYYALHRGRPGHSASPACRPWNGPSPLKDSEVGPSMVMWLSS